MHVAAHLCLALLFAIPAAGLSAQEMVGDWQMQDAAKVSDSPGAISVATYKPVHWYAATVPGTVLTTFVNNQVYPEPLYGENMRTIPESLNRATYWYRAAFTVPDSYRGRHTFLHFAGVNYSAEIWVNGHQAGSMRGAFIRGDFDVTAFVRPGKRAAVAVLVHPQPHPGTPHEHTIALGVGQNGGETALDGPTFLSTIGWDWLPAIRDRDTGIWLPVTISSTGPVTIRNPFVRSDLDSTYHNADLTAGAALTNLTGKTRQRDVGRSDSGEKR